MARAFIASVPLGIVLVAALVVPLAVIPGTFGFDRWPSSHGGQVTERQVRLAPPKVDVVAVRPRRAVPARHFVFVAARPRPTRVAPTVVAVAPAPRRPAPAPDRPARNPSPQPAHQPQPQPAPEPAPPQPQQPTKGDENLLADGNVPVAREVPQQEAPAPQPEPQPATPPVQPQVERVAPPVPCHGHGNDGGPHGDGDSQQ